jgi:hypothetical protein
MQNIAQNPWAGSEARIQGVQRPPVYLNDASNPMVRNFANVMGAVSRTWQNTPTAGLPAMEQIGQRMAWNQQQAARQSAAPYMAMAPGLNSFGAYGRTGAGQALYNTFGNPVGNFQNMFANIQGGAMGQGFGRMGMSGVMTNMMAGQMINQMGARFTDAKGRLDTAKTGGRDFEQMTALGNLAVQRGFEGMSSKQLAMGLVQTDKGGNVLRDGKGMMIGVRGSDDKSAAARLQSVAQRVDAIKAAAGDPSMSDADAMVMADQYKGMSNQRISQVAKQRAGIAAGMGVTERELGAARELTGQGFAMAGGKAAAGRLAMQANMQAVDTAAKAAQAYGGTPINRERMLAQENQRALAATKGRDFNRTVLASTYLNKMDRTSKEKNLITVDGQSMSIAQAEAKYTDMLKDPMTAATGAAGLQKIFTQNKGKGIPGLDANLLTGKATEQQIAAMEANVGADAAAGVLSSAMGKKEQRALNRLGKRVERRLDEGTRRALKESGLKASDVIGKVSQKALEGDPGTMIEEMLNSKDPKVRGFAEKMKRNPELVAQFQSQFQSSRDKMLSKRGGAALEGALAKTFAQGSGQDRMDKADRARKELEASAASDVLGRYVKTDNRADLKQMSADIMSGKMSRDAMVKKFGEAMGGAAFDDFAKVTKSKAFQSTVNTQAAALLALEKSGLSPQAASDKRQKIYDKVKSDTEGMMAIEGAKSQANSRAAQQANERMAGAMVDAGMANSAKGAGGGVGAGTPGAPGGPGGSKDKDWVKEIYDILVKAMGTNEKGSTSAPQ